MSHREQRDFCLSVKRKFPECFTEKTVLDVGSGDVNGNNNRFFSSCFVLGNDVAIGPNVSLICFAHELPFVDEFFDTIISTECFEHDRHYVKTLKSIVRMLKSGGLFVFTCATTGRLEHGTSKNKPYQAFSTRIVGLEDYYANVTEKDIRESILIDEVFEDYVFSVNDDHHDLYFWGVKR